MSDRWEPLEPWAHRAMGFGAMLLNLRLLLTRREFKQLPPENDRYPVLYVEKDIDDDKDEPGEWRVLPTWTGYEQWVFGRPPIEYWATPRVMDTLNDSREYDQGGTCGWFVLVAACVGLGYCIGRMAA